MTIGYLKGKIINVAQNFSNRFILLLEVNNIGHEIQVTPRFAQDLQAKQEWLPDDEPPITIPTHLQIQEDRHTLFGFASVTERDLFRQLISVSGIGTQLAIALLDTLTVPDLVLAVVSSNTAALSKTPGVGKKTAERIALELKGKLSQWQNSSEMELLPDEATSLNTETQEELEMTLLALSYTPTEIQQAIAAISQDSELQENPNLEEWLRKSITWLTGD